jgi:hypothetical protein
MANEVTLAQLRTRVRRRADMENTDFVADAELNDFINESLSELHDLFITKYEHHILKSVEIALVSGQEVYSFGNDFGISDFMKIAGLDIISGSNVETLHPFMFRERNAYNQSPPLASGIDNFKYSIQGEEIKLIPTPTNENTLRMWYIPQFTKMEVDLDEVGDTMPYMSPGWEEYAIVDSAIKCLQKEESDTQQLELKKMQLISRIDSIAANRDSGEPMRITDVSASNNSGWYF